jgi:5'-3' exonuclease
MDNHLIIDGNGLAYCAIYSTHQNIITGAGGKNYGPLIKVLKNIKDYAQSLKATKVWFTLDKQLEEGSNNFRKKLLTEYKSHRKDDGKKVLVHELLDDVVRFCESLGITVVQPLNMEADDVIYYLCKTIEGNKTVLTVDEDLLQLVDDTTSVFLFTKKKLVNQENFRANTKLTSTADYIKYKAVKGDVSDNIKGVYNYGPIKSLNAIAHWDEWYPSQSPENKKLIDKNIELIDLSVTSKYCPGEHASYKTQIDNCTAKFDFIKFKELSKECKICNFILSSSWKEVFNKINDDLYDFLDTL